jgi:hypothetical protein
MCYFVWVWSDRDGTWQRIASSAKKTDRMLDKPALPGYFRVIVIGEQGIMFGEVAITGRTVMN